MIAARRTLFLLLSTLALSSCFTMSKQECDQANWEALGRHDGREGNPHDRFGEYGVWIDACSKYGATKYKALYVLGLKAGLEEYCTESSGLKQGRKGMDYRHVCKGESERLFLLGYTVGIREHSLKEKEIELRKREEALATRERELLEKSEGGKSCTFDSDCTLKDSCSLRKCNRTNTTCNFDSDCDIKGRCYLGQCK